MLRTESFAEVTDLQRHPEHLLNQYSNFENSYLQHREKYSSTSPQNPHIPYSIPIESPMAPTAISPPLEREDHARDAAFNKILHGASAEKRGGMMAMMKKDASSQKAALDEYFKHWDNKTADVETDEIRKARRDEYASLTKQYVSQLTSMGTVKLIGCCP